MEAPQTIEFEQSRTYQNIQTAYENNLIQSTRHHIFNEIARSEGYIEIADSFNITAYNNRAHATIWLRQLNNGVLPSTLDNLISVGETTKYWGDIAYREYAQVAIEEGFPQVARLFSGIANIELNHHLIFQNYTNNLVTGRVFCKENQVLWYCMRCGNIMSGLCAPFICPVCGYPQSYYRVYT